MRLALISGLSRLGSHNKKNNDDDNDNDNNDDSSCNTYYCLLLVLVVLVVVVVVLSFARFSWSSNLVIPWYHVTSRRLRCPSPFF